jgi:hypothetical protein
MSTGELNEVGQPKYLTRTSLPAVHWSSFFEAVNKAFELHIASAGPPGQKAPVLVAEFPKTNEGKFDTSFDVILFHVVRSVRAPSDPHGRRIPKGPTPRETMPHPDKARYLLVTFGWWEMMTVRFTVYSQSRTRADQLTEWFHSMMMRYCFSLGFFKERGVHYMIFDGRGEDKFSREFGQELYTRTLDYDARLELLQNFEVKGLESLAIEIEETAPFTVQEEYKIPKP